MSRILRRPMFRGGRVDARGTGIASGLGYEKGGRVNYSNGGIKTAAEQRLEDQEKSAAKTRLSFETPYTNKTLQEMWADLKGGMYTGAPDSYENLNLGYGMQMARPLNTIEQGFQDYVDDYGDEAAFELWKSGKLKNFEGEDYGDLQKKQYAVDPSLFEGEEIETDTTELLDNPNDLLGAGNGAVTIPEKTRAEKLEEYQKMFEEAYGTGRGEDISNMLLSFAGKALKPEATVKSSFGEFFEDEAKRPSESKKYKDAATTAAINAFLTGEKTMAETESFMKRTKYQLTEADKIKKAKGPFMEGLTIQAKAEDKSVKNEGVISRQIVTTYGTGKDGGSLPEKVADFEEGMFYTGVDPDNKDVVLVYEIVEGDPIVRHRIR